MMVLYTGDILSGDKIGMATKVLATDHHSTENCWKYFADCWPFTQYFRRTAQASPNQLNEYCFYFNNYLN